MNSRLAKLLKSKDIRVGATMTKVIEVYEEEGEKSNNTDRGMCIQHSLTIRHEKGYIPLMD